MFATKVQHFLRMKNTSQEMNAKFHGWVQEYHKNIKPGPIFSDSYLIKTYLSEINDLKSFAINIKPFYIRSDGNIITFRKFLREMNIERNQPSSLGCILFNLLIGTKVNHIEKIITFSFWDRLIIQLIMAWCVLNKFQISLKTLFILVDQINGDSFGNIS